MRPVDKRFPMIFGFKRPYPPALQTLTGLTYHWGQDFACPAGTPVLSGVDGMLLSDSIHRGYGYLVEILFSTGFLFTKQYYIFRLAHLTINSCRFVPGSHLEKTDIVAASGSSGATVYADEKGIVRPHPHLHAELWKAAKVAGAWVRIELVSPALVTREELPSTISAPVRA